MTAALFSGMKQHQISVSKNPVFLGFILSIMIISIPFVINASTWADNGSYDIMWYDKTKTSFDISTPQQLAGVAYLVNNNYTSFSGQTLHLTKDINLTGKEWQPIGTNNTVFRGSLDGHGYTILGIDIKEVRKNACGFWITIRGAAVKNVNMIGCISAPGQHLGLLAAHIANSELNNISVSSKITYLLSKISTSSEASYSAQIGGIIGDSSDCTFSNISVTSNVSFEFGASNGHNLYGQLELDLGGIVGKSTKDSFENCFSENDLKVSINGIVTDSWYSNPKTASVYIGGCVGNSSSSSFISCLSKTLSFIGKHNNGTYDRVAFDYGGIVGNPSLSELKNCVAMTTKYAVSGHDYTWVSTGYHTSSTYGGISSRSPKRLNSCYSNNDIERTTSKVSSNNEGEHGSTSFSTPQMNSQQFVDEINFFCNMEFGEKRWNLNNDGKLVLIKNSDTDAIDLIHSDNNVTILGIYDLSGKKHRNTVKGINIIRYSDGSTKKVIH